MYLDRPALALIAVVVALVLAAAVAVWRRLSRLQGDLTALRTDPAVAAGVDPKAIRHVAVVRYDAFGDLGGQMSFSVALLDTAGDGVVLSAINGRSEARTYAKGIVAGTGAQQLSPEEQQAVGAALGRTPTRARP